MPTGVIINVMSVAAGGVLGSLAGSRLTADFKEKMNMIFGVSSMGMGVASIVLMKNMPAVIFALIIGTMIGLLIHLGDRIEKAAGSAQKVFAGGRTSGGAGSAAQFVTVIVLFCASGTGIYGTLVSGMSGDHSILISKSILDLFTAMIFACSLGIVVSAVSIPQAVIFLALFFLAKLIFPLTNETMINDFKACGGFIMVATGFRIIKVKMFPVADMIPAMILVMPLSYLWSAYILPLVS